MRAIPSPRLIAQAKRQEGFSSTPYLCTSAAATIGYGTNLEAWPSYIPYADIRQLVENGVLKGKALVNALRDRNMLWTKAEAEVAFLAHVDGCISQLEKRCSAYRALIDKSDFVRAEVLLNMCFNMGIGNPPRPGVKGRGLLSFVTTLKFIETGAYSKAASNMLASQWATQVKGRAVELAEQMLLGKWR